MRGPTVCLALFFVVSARAESVSFRQEIMPAFARAGCNQGACHGNLNGKGGFKLSLRGEDPAADLIALTRDMFARRTDSFRPEESLLLRKATGRVPHEGGPRFAVDSPEYRLLYNWIANGCPDDPRDRPQLVQLDVSPASRILFEPADRVKIDVIGRFADRTTRNLTHLAVFEPTVAGAVHIAADGTVTRIRPVELNVVVRYLDRQMPVILAFLPARSEYVTPVQTVTHPVDKQLLPQLQSLRLTTSPPADDSMFIRRAFLDALGMLPSADEARAFLDDPSPAKRDRLIDGLLRRPEFSDFWAQKWADLLRLEEKALDRKGVRVFHQWVRDAIDVGKPLNEFARELIAARGSTYQNPPANLYRSLREPYARAEAVAQVFLGVRLQCAKCHNHPFERWTQDDYHQFAAFFGRINYRVVENSRRDKFDLHEFDGEQLVYLARESGLKHPRSKETLIPRLLGSEQSSPNGDPLQALADWVADPSNPFFARAQVNRVWYHLMGRGLVEPIDDFRGSNPAVNEPLLDELAKQFVKFHFDLRALVRLIMTSRTYQVSSHPAGTNAEDEVHFSKAIVRPLEAEQLLDAVAQVTGSRPRFDGYPAGTRAGQVAALGQERRSRKGGQAERFLKAFGKPERLLTCECERSDDMGLVQAFQLLTGDMLQEMLTDSDNRIGKALTSGRSDREIVEELYLAALSRRPTEGEMMKLVGFIGKAKDRRAAVEDIVWGLVNAKEFLLRR
ncbi:MAG TPA: DUF1549 and DUF1553 domain-containing protein [Gemmataceae bacterium]|jgi:hypothetical protein|nr:DUF1549 and DUF1553 domain-containing protein [Gemmataceae bacterium]